jgi:cold shock CspA family protein
MRNLLIVLIVLAAGVVGLGLYRNWFSVTVNKGKMKDDANTAKDLAADVFKGKTKETTGTVKTVEQAESRFTVKTEDNPEMIFLLSDASKFSTNQEAGKRADLKAGDQVTVKFREKDGKNQATSVVIDRK